MTPARLPIRKAIFTFRRGMAHSTLPGGRDYGDSVLKLDGSSLAIRDYFTPLEEERISDADADIGSSGPTLLPDQPGPHRHFSCNRPRIRRSMSSTVTTWASSILTTTPWYKR